METEVEGSSSMSKEEVIRRRGSSGEIDGIVSVGIVLSQWERTLGIIVSSQRENTELTTSRDDMDRRERWMGLIVSVLLLQLPLLLDYHHGHCYRKRVGPPC